MVNLAAVLGYIGVLLVLGILFELPELIIIAAVIWVFHITAAFILSIVYFAKGQTSSGGMYLLSTLLIGLIGVSACFGAIFGGEMLNL